MLLKLFIRRKPNAMQSSVKHTMRALLAVYVVITTIKATTAAWKVEVYSQEADQEQDYYERGPVRNTVLINYSNVKIQFRQQNVRHDNALHMAAVSEEGTSRGKLIGVRMDAGQKHFFGITRFGIETIPAKREMQFLVFLQHDGQPNVLLEIPAFQDPEGSPKTIPGTPWPRKNDVGTLSPVSVEQLDNLLSSKEVTIGFEWLSQLLTHGVRGTGRSRTVGGDTVDEYYRTRPVLLKKDVIQKCMDVVEHFKVKYEPRFLSPNQRDRTSEEDVYEHLRERATGWR